jgi:hypothetical protein
MCIVKFVLVHLKAAAVPQKKCKFGIKTLSAINTMKQSLFAFDFSQSNSKKTSHILRCPAAHVGFTGGYGLLRVLPVF